MPSPTSNNTSPTRADQSNAAREFLERERASLEAINAIGMVSGNSSPKSRVPSGSQDAIVQDVAGLAIHSQGSSPTIDTQMVEPESSGKVDENGDHIMEPAPHMDIDHNLRRESEKIEYPLPSFVNNGLTICPITRAWRKTRAAAIAAKEEESDRVRDETRKKAQSELASFLKEYSHQVEERRARPIDTAAYMTAFDGNKDPRLEGKVDWVAVQKLLKLLPASASNIMAAERFIQIVNNKAEQQQQQQ